MKTNILCKDQKYEEKKYFFTPSSLLYVWQKALKEINFILFINPFWQQAKNLDTDTTIQL